RERTSTDGRTLVSASWNTRSGSCPERFWMRSKAPYTMLSATDFLPSCIRQFMNLVTTASPNLGSGRTSRLTAARRRDMALLLSRPLRAVFRAALAPVLDALGVVRAADDVIAHAGQILDPAAANQHHRVLLQIVALAGDIAGHFEAVGETDARDLAQRRIRLFRRRRGDARADPAFLRALLHRRHLVARNLRLARLVDQLVYRRHPSPNPIEHDNRPTAKRAPGGSLSLPTECTPSY